MVIGKINTERFLYINTIIVRQWIGLPNLSIKIPQGNSTVYLEINKRFSPDEPVDQLSFQCIPVVLYQRSPTHLQRVVALSQDERK